MMVVNLLMEEYQKYLLENGDYSKKYKVKNKEELQSIINYFSGSEQKDVNLNWLDVSNITDMSNLFKGIEYNPNIKYWDVSNVTNMSGMFAESKFDGDISNWDVSNVKDMSKMFWQSSFNGDISSWNVSNVVNMYGIFSENFSHDISNWKLNRKSNCNFFINCDIFKTSKQNRVNFFSLDFPNPQSIGFIVKNKFVTNKYIEVRKIFWEYNSNEPVPYHLANLNVPNKVKINNLNNFCI